MDKRRKKWMAWDIFFFSKPTGLAIRKQFGVAGLALFQGFLAGCKRSAIPGQMTYTSEADFLSQIGLPGLILKNEQGERYDLDSYWRRLGQLKQTRIRRSGDVKHIESTQFFEWQKEFERQEDAERKGRSRDKKAWTISGNNPDDTQTIEGLTRQDITRQDKTNVADNLNDDLVFRRWRELVPKTSPMESAAAFHTALKVVDRSVVDLTLGQLKEQGISIGSNKYILTAIKNKARDNGIPEHEWEKLSA